MTPWTAAHQAALSSAVSQSLLKFMSTELLILCNHLNLGRSLFSQFLPASGYFSMSRLFTSGGQRIGASATASAPPLNIQGWFPLEFTGLISLQSKGLSLNNVRSIKLYSRTLWHMTMWLITLTRLFCDRFKMTSWGLKGDLSPYSWSNGRQIETRHQLR